MLLYITLDAWATTTALSLEGWRPRSGQVSSRRHWPKVAKTGKSSAQVSIGQMAKWQNGKMGNENYLKFFTAKITGQSVVEIRGQSVVVVGVVRPLAAVVPVPVPDLVVGLVTVHQDGLGGRGSIRRSDSQEKPTSSPPPPLP